MSSDEEDVEAVIAIVDLVLQRRNRNRFRIQKKTLPRSFNIYQERIQNFCLGKFYSKDYEFSMLAGVLDSGRTVRCSAVIIDRFYLLAPSDCITRDDVLRDMKVFIAHGESATSTINKYTFDLEAFETIRENNKTARIKLIQPIDFDEHVMPACMLRSFDNYLYAGSTVTSAGYHYINLKSKLTSFKMDLLLVSRHTCERQYPNTTDQLCTFSKYATKFNIPGSPIFYKDPGYNRVYVIGFSKHMYKASSEPEYHIKIEFDPESIVPKIKYHELQRPKRNTELDTKPIVPEDGSQKRSKRSDYSDEEIEPEMQNDEQSKTSDTGEDEIIPESYKRNGGVNLRPTTKSSMPNSPQKSSAIDTNITNLQLRFNVSLQIE